MSTPPPAPEPYDARSGAPQYAPPVNDYAQPAHTKGGRGLGLIAFLAALAGAVIGSILGFVGGMQSGSLAQYVDITGTTQVDPNTIPPEGQNAAVVGGILTLVAFLVWGALALWGLIQGIIAAVKNRGRGWGIAAIIVAVIGIGAVLTFTSIGVAVGAGPYLGNM
ncbi:hypothetical protein ACO03V_05265 [Microbacterium sp. HMH0099]|uniref:hypothetical protein n=1 Tax=Microbacterium sp. HMH0099 TaxID=3414026 RepID=UPI003BF698CC